MNPIDVSKIDLNLLSAFEVLMQERHVTRAAARLGLGQPAVSHALARLRDLTGDALFVRNGRVMEPTERALALREGFAPALAQIEATLRGAQPFDAKKAAPIFRIGLSDDLQIAYLPKIVSALRKVIPNARLVTLPVDYRTAAQRLDAGDISVAMSFLANLPAGAKVRVVRKAGYAVLRADTRRGRIDLDQYCTRPHALVTYAGDLRGLIDDHLERMGRARIVLLSVPMFGTLPAILKDTDLLATVPEHVARALATQGGLRVDPLPFETPTFDISLAWRAVTDKDAGERILRETLLAALGERG